MNSWRGSAVLLAALLVMVPTVQAEQHTEEADDDSNLDWNWFGSLRARPEYNDNLSDLFTSLDDKVGYVNYRANLGASIDLDQDVTVLVDVQALGAWGETGSPQRGFQGFDSSDSRVDFFRAYIEARKVFGTNFGVRVGRQPLIFGDEWLLGDSDFYGGTSWDGIRGDFDTERGGVSVFWAKGGETDNPESSSTFGDVGGDYDLYGIWTNWQLGEAQGLDAAVLYDFDHRFVSPFPFTDKRFTAHARYHFGADRGFFFNGDVGYQWGDTLDSSQSAITEIKATAFELTGGFVWERASNPYKLWARFANYGGDETNTSDNETFVPVAQDLHARYGILDLWGGGWGFTPFIGGFPGFQVFQLGVDGTLPNTLRIRLTAQKMWRDQEVPGNDNKNLGEEYGLSVFYNYGKNLELELGIGQLYPGASAALEPPFFGNSTARRIYVNTVARF